MKIREFCYRLFFTRDDDLDVLQLAFLLLIAVFVVVFWRHALVTGWRPETAMLTLFGSVFGILAIAGTPRWVAELIAKSKLPGEVAAAVAQADPRLPSRTDDERLDAPLAPDRRR